MKAYDAITRIEESKGSEDDCKKGKYNQNNYKNLDYTGNSIINFSTTIDFKSKQLDNISSIMESKMSNNYTVHMAHKALISHIFNSNHYRDYRLF